MTTLIMKDGFGNTLITSKVSPKEIYEQTKATDITKGVIIKGADKSTIDKYNDLYGVETGNALYQGMDTGDRSVYLIPQESSCPILDNGKSRAGGFNVLVYRNDKIYVLLVKDKTKPVLTSFGGTCQPGESYMDAAIRETEEETNGDIKAIVDDQELVTAIIDTTYYGIKVDDTYQCYYYLLKNQELIDYLFANDMKKKYDNLETDYIQLFELNPDNLDDYSTIKGSKPSNVSEFHWFISHVHMDICDPFSGIGASYDDLQIPRVLSLEIPYYNKSWEFSR